MRYVIGAAGGVVVFMVLMLILALSVPVVSEVRQAKAVIATDTKGYVVPDTGGILVLTGQLYNLYYDDNEYDQRYDFSRCFLKFELPEELRGVTPTSAVLKLKASLGSPGAAVEVVAKSTTGAWSAESNLATMTALTLSDPLDTVEVDGAGWVQWNVLGSAAAGVREACEQSRETITLVVDYNYTHAPASVYINPSLNSLLYVGLNDNTTDDFVNFAWVSPDAPVLEITYTEDPGGGTGPGGWPAGTPQVRHGGTVGVLFG